MFNLTGDVIDPNNVRNAVRRSEAGALVVFEGVTRNHHEDREVIRLEYEAYASMAESQMAEIGRQVQLRWPDVRIAMQHRLGVVAVGEASVVIAVSAPHRGPAYEASQFAIEELKRRVPIWKREVYADGSIWKANREVSP